MYRDLLVSTVQPLSDRLKSDQPFDLKGVQASRYMSGIRRQAFCSSYDFYVIFHGRVHLTVPFDARMELSVQKTRRLSRRS